MRLAELVCVDPKEIRRIWPHASRFIKRAILRTGLSDFREVEDSILDGDALLWLVWNGERIEAAVSTILEVANTKKSCVIVACGGDDMANWIDLIDQIETYAKNEGCQSTRIIGRRGWLRVLEGYRADYAILEKAI